MKARERRSANAQMIGSAAGHSLHGPPRRACKELGQVKGKKRERHDLLSTRYIIPLESVHAVDHSRSQDLVADCRRFAHAGAGVELMVTIAA